MGKNYNSVFENDDESYEFFDHDDASDESLDERANGNRLDTFAHIKPKKKKRTRIRQVHSEADCLQASC